MLDVYKTTLYGHRVCTNSFIMASLLLMIHMILRLVLATECHHGNSTNRMWICIFVFWTNIANKYEDNGLNSWTKILQIVPS